MASCTLTALAVGGLLASLGPTPPADGSLAPRPEEATTSTQPSTSATSPSPPPVATSTAQPPAPAQLPATTQPPAPAQSPAPAASPWVFSASSSPASAATPTVHTPQLVEPPTPRWARKAKRMSSKDRKSARTALATGGALFGVFYLAGSFVAAHNLDDIHRDGVVERSERNERRAAILMFIPVVGPLAASPLGESSGDKAALAGYGILQALATAAVVTGAVMVVRDRRARRLRLMASPAPGGGAISLRGRF